MGGDTNQPFVPDNNDTKEVPMPHQSNEEPLKAAIQCANFIRERLLGDHKPTLGLVLGSGLGDFAESVSEESISYVDAGFTRQGNDLPGHAGRLHVATIGGKTVLIMQGRLHYYEGHSLQDVVLPIRTMTMLGAGTHIITCASGGVNTDYAPGTLVIIKDHLNLVFDSPLRGPNNYKMGPRFLDMTQAYDLELRQMARIAAKRIGIEVKEGVYAMMPGPTYETPAEVRMLKVMGADMAGMSTVPEVTAARHMGARILGISCVSNHAAGIKEEALCHSDVVAAGQAASDKFARLITAIIEQLPS